jgi:hypothetical protein
VEKVYAIAMEGLQTQLQKSLTSNTLLKEKLKDQEHQNRQKQKEIEDLRQGALNSKSGREASTRSLIISRRHC